ncbi:MAG TPA: sigma factor-like helix-turn-helix DNA-binding protein [Thermoanaerobaculia bacterium]|nr:sigma factor-like helix-turn-helix DNA-binding protein [Thermoanaerobaculia bacterium]
MRLSAPLDLREGPGEAESVRRAAQSLTQLERDVLGLASGLGLSNAEIAARLRISERRAERVLARAIVRFGHALEGGGRCRRPW